MKIAGAGANYCLAHQTELADAMKIPPKNFRWRAAFHDEKHHPHIHMMVWSADPKQGFLTEKGIEKMRSRLSNEIFRDELLSLYQQKDQSYQQVRDRGGRRRRPWGGSSGRWRLACATARRSGNR